MVITRELEVSWCPSNKKHFENIGYKYTKMKDKFIVKFEDMPHSSDIKIQVKCDYCGKIFTKQIKKHYSGINVIKKDCCSECRNIKAKDSRIEKYGYMNAYVNGYTVEKHKQKYLNTVGIEIFEKINEICKSNNYSLITKEYVNNKTPIEYICNKHSEYGIQKTNWIHLKRGQGCYCCAIESKSGKNSCRWKGGNTELRLYLRHAIKPWVNESLMKSEYKCDISGKQGKLEVHHANKSFNEIFNETVSITNLPIKLHIGDYSQDELKLLSATCLELHYKYGLGVCLTPEYHKLFHSTYGNINTTLSQYLKFKSDFKI